jgi:hypothetical protein
MERVEKEGVTPECFAWHCVPLSSGPGTVRVVGEAVSGPDVSHLPGSNSLWAPSSKNINCQAVAGA